SSVVVHGKEQRSPKQKALLSLRNLDTRPARRPPRPARFTPLHAVPRALHAVPRALLALPRALHPWQRYGSIPNQRAVVPVAMIRPWIRNRKSFSPCKLCPDQSQIWRELGSLARLKTFQRSVGLVVRRHALVDSHIRVGMWTRPL